MTAEVRPHDKAPMDSGSAYVVSGDFLKLKTLASLVSGATEYEITQETDVLDRMRKSESIVDQSVSRQDCIYGVTTGFGGMADGIIPAEFASRLQNNLLNFLSAGFGDSIAGEHTKCAMLIRANMLLRGHSGIRVELVRRLIQFAQVDALPVVHEQGSIGASGDLIPLATIARAIVGHDKTVKVDYQGERISSDELLKRLNLESIELNAKEGLALINGTSFSAAIAANSLHSFKNKFALSLAIQAMLLRAKLAHEDPFMPFVHECKPHPGQKWIAQSVLALMQTDAPVIQNKNQPVQDRYSVRCIPQYLGSNAEGVARLIRMVEVELNSVSDNPLVDLDSEQLFQSGNFLGQYIGVGMDELRRIIALTAKHLDVQIAHLVAPEFNGGLPPSLRGNDDEPVNMGLKGLQIAGNSLVPMLLHQAAPLVEHYPTYAEQFNQNVNGLSWGSANLAWKSNVLFGDYLAIACIFAVQACDLRAKNLFGDFDGRRIIGSRLMPVYETVLKLLNVEPGGESPLLFDDGDRCLEDDIAVLAENIKQGANGSPGSLSQSVAHVVESFERELESA